MASPPRAYVIPSERIALHFSKPRPARRPWYRWRRRRANLCGLCDQVFIGDTHLCARAYEEAVREINDDRH